MGPGIGAEMSGVDGGSAAEENEWRRKGPQRGDFKGAVVLARFGWTPVAAGWRPLGPGWRSRRSELPNPEWSSVDEASGHSEDTRIRRQRRGRSSYPGSRARAAALSGPRARRHLVPPMSRRTCSICTPPSSTWSMPSSAPYTSAPLQKALPATLNDSRSIPMKWRDSIAIKTA
jgi:hypothetical protein